MALNPETRPAAAADDRTLVITRIFDAPPTLMFWVWTDQGHMLNWLGPRSHPAVSFEHEFKVGGAWRACLKSLDGTQILWQGGTYREIQPPHRLAYSFAWDGSAETLITVDFLDQGGKTRMIFSQTPFETVERREGHRGGWTSCFDRLEDMVRSLGPAA